MSSRKWSAYCMHMSSRKWFFMLQCPCLLTNVFILADTNTAVFVQLFENCIVFVLYKNEGEMKMNISRIIRVHILCN